jgi:hypothetical protein
MKKPIDQGTVELGRHFTVVPTFTGPNVMAGRVVDETAIDRLFLREEINITQHATLMAFTKRLHKYGFFALKSPNYEGFVQMDPTMVGDRKANMLRGMVKIFAALDKEIGPPRRKALVDLCLKDTPWSGDDLHRCINALDRVMRPGS